mgnify:CR=1 FL=1
MKPSINLATRTYINRRALRSGMLAAVTALVCWAVVGGYLLARDWHYLSELKEKSSSLMAQRDELRGNDGQPVNAAELERRWAEVDFINQLLERDSYQWTELLDKLEAQAFSGVVVRSINPSVKDNNLSLVGYARELRHLRKFIDNLIASGDFDDVYLLSQSQEKIEDSAGRERKAIVFELSLERED